MRTIPMMWFLPALAACGGWSIPVEVVPAAEGAAGPTFEWAGGPVDKLDVQECLRGCDVTECGRLVPFESGGAVWNAGVSNGDDPGPDIESPLVYGDPEAPSGAEAEPLEPGKLYAVTMYRTDCRGGQCSGCQLFTVEE